jgi:hypothetical protein
MKHAISPFDDKSQNGTDRPTEGLSPSASEGNLELIGDSEERREQIVGNDKGARPSNEKLLVSHGYSYKSLALIVSLFVLVSIHSQWHFGHLWLLHCVKR